MYASVGLDLTSLCPWLSTAIMSDTNSMTILSKAKIQQRIFNKLPKEKKFSLPRVRLVLNNTQILYNRSQKNINQPRIDFAG